MSSPEESKKYNNIKLAVGISKTVISFVLLYLFVTLGYSNKLIIWINSYTSNDYLLLISFIITTGVVSGVLFFPVNYYSGFYLEHKYDLSNQTFIKWILEDLKGLLIFAAIGIPILLAFYFSLKTFGGIWWLPFAILLFIVSVLLARIVPVLILPLFYKLTPIDDEELKRRITLLAIEAGVKVENVYRFDMSKNTKKANAAFTGIGKSKRILLGDTLLDNYTKDEIETVIAHELGHYKKKHIIKNIVIGTVSSFLTLFLIAKLYDVSLTWFGFDMRTDIAALPLLSLWAMLIGLIQTPLGNILSRKYEYEADRYAVDVTKKPEAFVSTLRKLTSQNLGDENPNPFVEWFFYSHPSINNRVNAIIDYSGSTVTSLQNLQTEQ
ncbi:MAG: peptidase [Ignavibacteria bacterium CG2_30_36_16]|nr:M48 family metallopeptidase [Ignavibacteria bacterium]OIP62460.1 MAG: peptidase [Ignavibacteria bacterium CG2_30_36_16]PJA99751.1 MAG: peptidase [Ignavibacteria bacterium CG_4_9_14_3_um_filter_36_18]